MKTLYKHLVLILPLIAFCLGCFNEAMAANRTLYFQNQPGGYMKYKIGNNSWVTIAESDHNRKSVANVPDGTTVIVEAFPSSGYYFKDWSSCSAYGSPDAGYNHSYLKRFTYTVSDNHTQQPRFTNTSYLIKATASPSGSSTIKISGPVDEQNVPAAGIRVAAGSRPTLTATVNTGYTFVNWKEGSTELTTSTSYTISDVAAAHTLTANATDTWAGALENNCTYTLTTVTGGPIENAFKVTCSLTSSPYHNKTYCYIGNIVTQNGAKVSIVFNTSKTCLVNGQILAWKGDLTLSLGSGYTYSNNRPTLKRTAGSTGSLVKLNTTDNTFADYKLTITGGTSSDYSKNFIIHSGCDHIAIDSTTYGMHDIRITRAASDLTATEAVISVYGGTVDLDYVTVTHQWTTQVGGLMIGGWKDNRNCLIHVSMDNCLFEWIKGGAFGAGVKVDNYTRGSWTTMNNCEFKYIYDTKAVPDEENDFEYHPDYGGAVRSSGNNLTSLTMEDCLVHHNYTTGDGGGVRWNATLIDPSLTMNRCTLRNNWAKGSGGGIRVEGQAEMQSCVFKNNRAEQDGGGISFGTFRIGGAPHLHVGGGVWFPKNGSVVLDENTVVENNEAGHCGGGIHMSADFITVDGGTAEGIVYEPFITFLNDSLNPYKVILKMEGALVKDNRAEVDGGAVCMTRNTDYYQLITDLKYGTINNNNAVGNGGAFCITENDTIPYPSQGTTFTHPLTGVTYQLSKQTIHANLGNDADSTSLSMTNNTAVNGGGIYVNGGSVTIYDNAVVGGVNNKNYCTGGNGGAICVTGGGLVMKGGDVSYNQAYKEGNDGGNGGGFYVTGGQVSVEGGTIYRNIAAVDGGGFYVDVPSITDTTFIKGGAQVTYNRAQNGGGAYISQGTLAVEDSGTSISNDTAYIAGGGIYMANGAVYDSLAAISGNISQSSDGGAFFIEQGSFTAVGSEISGNKAPAGNGGGAYVGSGNVTLKVGTTVTDNTAIDGGGIYVDGGNLAYTNAVMSDNTATNNGGGFYTTGGDVLISGNSAEVSSNTATNWGGGMFIGGDIALNGGTIKLNHAGKRGGGVYVDEGGRFNMTGGTIGSPFTVTSMDSICPANQEVVLYGDTITPHSDTTITFYDTIRVGNYTTGIGSYGGGLYMGGGTAEITGGSISGNYTDNAGYGGGIYMDGGDCILKGGSNVGGAGVSYANHAKYGGGIYSAGGTIWVKGGKIAYNEAVNGGGIYSFGESPKVYVEKESSKADVLSYIEHNTADNGGGIYARRGEVHFSDGFIQYNMANQYGGGMYVDSLGTLFLKGNANLYRNHVPASYDGSTNGGGVYLLGQVTVGEKTDNPADLGIIKAQENFKGDHYVYEYNHHTPELPNDSIDQVTANNRNNIYLPDPGDTLVLTNHRDVITVIEDGISLQSRVGFSVPHNYVPVIYCALSDSIIPSGTPNDTAYWGWHSSHKYLNQFSTGHDYQYLVFDDTRHYVAVHYPDKPGLFDPDHVYLYGFWANVVTGNEYDFECGTINPDDWEVDTIPIYNACELAFFISWVNGLNNQSIHESANAKLMADIDMSKYGWVPIGDLTHGYKGCFDGNGHTVTGISGLLYREYKAYGFFGRLDGGTVKNLFVKDALYALDNVDDLSIGGLVGEITTASTVSNCEVSSNITATNSGTVMGGLVGRMNAGTVHSTIGISDMKGYLMGGLVGELLGGSLYNSFSNCKYAKANPGHQMYMGGLAAVNRGTVENCYARLRGSVPKGKFGILVGDNTDGVVNYCYAPAGMTNYKAAGANPTGHGNYGDSFLPYLYGHRDTQVSLANSSNSYVPNDASADKQMMVALNNWVDAKSTASVTYTTWGRPWHESDAVKPLNDDYPILRMPKCEAVGAKAGDPYLYYNPVDSLLVRYTDAESAIWLYRNPADVVRGDNSGSSAKLYIAEDVVLKNLNELKAYVGITLDNSAGGNGANPTYGQMVGITTDATDWHMISSPLMDAPIGINYSDNGSYDFSWGHPEGMPYYLFYQKGNLRSGYFPSHRFGESYPSSDATIEAGNYYNEWDFYAYCEPVYHWINFKRNSNSHRHFDTETHERIAYDNEPSLIPGKGYFAATREETFLQCQGNLNADEVTLGLTMTSGVPRHGYNLIGNPYQAYLDFDAFAEYNSDDVDAIWDDKTTASYTILDEDAASYLTFAYDGSDNPDAAGRFIHPHQGFFVRTGLDGSMAYFHPDMRNTTARNSTFRSNDHIDYPLVNLFVSEANGNSDMVTVELGRPTQGGALLMQGLRAGNGKIWCHYNDVDYAVAYTQPGITEAAIRFETVADTEYTMRWNTHNGDFSYLHLIDNVTGADIDCLTTDEYKFSASTSDYKSRFRLVFGYTGIEEDTEAEANENFAFIMNDELVVTGEGVLQVFDVTGRMVMSQELHGVQTTVSLPAAANGVYVLRLTEGKQSRVQKMVISK